MPKSDTSSLDVSYMKRLYEDLSSSNKEQARALAEMGKSVGEMGIILKSMDEKQSEHSKKLERYEERIRKVERGQDSCEAAGQIRGIWHHIKRLNLFRDAILDRSREDSQMVNIQALERSSSAAAVPFRDSAIRMLPWFIVVFAVGIALATIVAVQMFSGRQIIDIPSMGKATASGVKR